MAKLITVNKNDLHVSNGVLLDAEDNIIPGFGAAACQFKAFNEMMNKAAYLAAQPDKSPAPSLEGYHESKCGRWVDEAILPDEWAVEVLEDAADEQALKDAAIEELVATDKVRDLAMPLSELYRFCECETLSYIDGAKDYTMGWDPRILVLSPEEITAGLAYWVEQRDRMETGVPCRCCEV